MQVPGLLSETSTDADIISYIQSLIAEMKSYSEKMKSVNTTTSWKQDIVNTLSREFEQLTVLTVDRNNEQIKNGLTELSSILSEYRGLLGTASDGAIALQLLLNDSTFKRIQEIEKQIMYRRFYFPGGVPQLRVVDENDLAAYDYWDPRIYKDYIIMAQQRGFHRYFIIYDSLQNNFRTSHFSEADTTLNMHIDWLTGTWVAGSGDVSDSIKYACTDMLAGLIYFNKLDTFLKEFEITHTSKSLNKLRTNLYDTIQSRIKKLQTFIGQTEKNFKNDDIGWTSFADNSYAFDSAQLLPEWISLQQKYEEFQNKVFEILSQLDALQLCTNYNYAFGNNIYLNQSVECMQTVIKNETNVEVHEDIIMGDAEKGDADTGEQGGAVEEENKEEEEVVEEEHKEDEEIVEEPAEDEEVLEEEKEKPSSVITPTYDPSAADKDKEKEKEKEKPPEEKPPEEKPPEEKEQTKDNNEDKQQEEEKDKNKEENTEEPFYKKTWFIIVCIISVLALTALILFLTSSPNPQQNMQNGYVMNNNLQNGYVQMNPVQMNPVQMNRM